MFKIVTDENIWIAAKIHVDSWKESHKTFCSSDFVKRIQQRLKLGIFEKKFWKGRVFISIMIVIRPKELFRFRIIWLKICMFFRLSKEKDTEQCYCIMQKNYAQALQLYGFWVIMCQLYLCIREKVMYSQERARNWRKI